MNRGSLHASTAVTLILAALTIAGCVLLVVYAGWWGVTLLALIIAVQIVHVVRHRRFVAVARDLEQLYRGRPE